MSNDDLVHRELTLFDCPRVRRREYWQFIKLVAPSTARPAGQTHWLSQDASDAFCLKCQRPFRFLKGSSNSVRRHMERYHAKDLQRYLATAGTAAAAAAAAAAATAATAASSVGANDHGERRTNASSTSTSTPSSTSTSTPSSTINSAAKDKMLHRKPKRQLHDEDPDSPAAAAAANVKKHTTRGSVSTTSSFGPFEQRNAAELLVKWLCCNLRALATVDEPGFADFIGYLSSSSGDGDATQSFVLPGSEALSHRLELMAENTKFEMRQGVKKELGPLALSAALWQPRERLVEGLEFVALSCHSLTDEFERNARMLEVIPLEGTADGFSAQMAAAVRDWGLQKLPLVLLCNGDDERIASGGRALGLRCFQDIDASLARILSQSPGLFGATSAASDSDSAIWSALAELRCLATGLNANLAAREKLQEIYSTVGGGRLRLTGYAATSSWTEVFAFLSQAVLWQASLDLFFAFAATPDGSKLLDEAALSKPAAKSWFVAEALVLILQPFHELVDVVAAEKTCSLPFIVPCLSVIKQQLEREDLLRELALRYRTPDSLDALPELRVFQNLVLSAFLRQYDVVCRELQWCSALDPRYAKLRHLSEGERELCKVALVERAMELFVSQLPPVAPSESLGGLPGDFEGEMMYGVGARASAAQGLMHRLLYDDEEDVSVSEVLSRESEIAQTRLFVANEVQMYASEHQLRKTRVACPLQWWQANRERFPFLAPLARVWLGSVASWGAGSPFALRRSLPDELCANKSASSDSTSSSVSKKVLADTIFLHANLRARSESFVSL